MDFLFLLYGLVFFILAIVCRALRKTSLASLLPWSWLSAFGFFHAANEWMHAWEFSAGESGLLSLARWVLRVASYLALFMFGLKSGVLRSSSSPRLVELIAAGFVLLGLSGAWGGVAHLNVTTRYFMALPGALWAAWAFRCAGRDSGPGNGRYLKAVALFLAGYAVAAGGLVPKTDFLLAAYINNEWFEAWTGLPIHMLRVGLGFGAIAVLWRLYVRVMPAAPPGMGRLGRSCRYRYALLLMAVLAGGWLLTDNLGHKEERENRREVSEMAAAAASIDPRLHAQLQGVPEDEIKPAYAILREQLIRIQASKRLPGAIATLLVVFLLTYMFIGQQQVLTWNQLMAESEKRYRTLVDGSPNTVMLLNPEGWIQSVNPSGLAAFGYSLEELRRRPLVEFMPASSREALGAAFRRTFEGKSVSLEVEYQPPEGSVRYWSVTLTPMADNRGGMCQAVGVLVDVTGRKQAELALQESERKLGDLIDFLPDPTLAIDQTGHVMAWNKAMERMTGIPKSEMIGRGEYAYGIPFYGHPRPILADAVLRGADPLAPPYDFIHKNGAVLTAEVYSPHIYSGRGAYLWGTASGLYDGAGRLIGAIECIRDVTAVKTAEADLKKAQLQLGQHVAERTTELARVNADLVAEIAERVKTEKDLKESEKKYRELVDSLPQIVFETDRLGRITFVNRIAYAVSGYTKEEIEHDLSIFDVFDPADHEKIRTNFELFMKGQSVRGVEYTLVTKSGVRIPVAAYSRTKLVKQRPVGLAGFLVDITDQKQAGEVMRKDQAMLEERVAARTAELAATNESLKSLLQKQEVNIHLAHEVLAMVNPAVPRHTPLGDRRDLFIATLHIPCHLEGGDHFFVQNLPATSRHGARTIVSLKDQSGHEVGCILRSIVTDLLHHALLGRSESMNLPEVIRELNRQIRQSDVFGEDDFFTAMNLEIEHDNLHLNLLSAGHPPFLLIREGRVIRLPLEKDPGSNPPIGWIDMAEVSVGAYDLRERDRLFLYTDGFLDIPRKRGLPAMRSEDLCRVTQELVDENPDRNISALIDELFHRIAGSPPEPRQAGPFDDDVAVLGVEIEGPGKVLEDILQPRDSNQLSALIKSLLQRIREEWLEQGFEKPDTRLRMALEEAILNAWHHGNRESQEKRIIVRRQYGNDARIDVLDEGQGFDFHAVYDPRQHENRDKPSGRGLFVMRLFTEALTWYDRGRHVAMYFARKASPEGRDRKVLQERLSLW